MSDFDSLINSPTPVLVDFFAEWCGPCKMMAPILDTVKKNMGESVGIIKIDVDKNQALATQYQIQSVPTLLLFVKGELKWRQSGVVQAADLEKIINQAAQPDSK